MRVVVLSDTHSPRFWKRCPSRVAARLGGADLILHAGDVCTTDVLDELAQYAPVRVVCGNNDGPEVRAWGAPDSMEFEIDSLKVAMIHDSGPRPGRLLRLRKRFPDADLVVFGHSHIPLDESDGSFRILNPGSPTDKRRQQYGTLVELEVLAGALTGVELIRVT